MRAFSRVSSFGANRIAMMRPFSTTNRHTPLPEGCLNKLFNEARTHFSFTDKKIPTETLKKLYDLTKMAPTATNCSPARFIFVQSPEAKNRLLPCAMEGNRGKIQSAPVTVIVAVDTEFEKQIPFLFPFNPEVPSWYAPKDVHDASMMTNGNLQAAYFIMAARSLGLDVGPMGGFDSAALDKEFFDGTGKKYRSTLLINLGYGDKPDAYPRAPRFEFEQACEIL